MHKILYTYRARTDLFEIKTFIAKDNPYYAEKVLERISTFLDNYLSIFPKQ
jgi:plasmid stabilization system protein ParE